MKLNFIQPRKEKRFKIFFKYEARKGPPMHVKARLPKHGGFEDGPSMGLDGCVPYKKCTKNIQKNKMFNFTLQNKDKGFFAYFL